MRNDEVIKSIRYILDLDDVQIANILKLADYEPTRDEINAIFQETYEEEDATHELMAHFLDGFIYFKRGKSDKHPPQPIQIPVTNNMVLKKLRVAFKLRESDILQILKSTDFTVTPTELSALFRAENHRNYRSCGDQLLRYFLKGLAYKYRKK